MWPSWLNDLATLVGIITGLPIIFGWIISSLGRGIKPLPKSQPLQPARRERVTLWGLIRTGIFEIVIRPEIPAWRDTLDVVVGTIFLSGASIFYLWNTSFPIELQRPPLQRILLAILGLRIVIATLLWARLFLKIRYLNQMQG